MTPSHPAILGSPLPDPVRDPDEDARTIRRLMESEERLRGILEAITNFLIRFNPSGRVTFVNDAYCRHVGQSRETILGPDWFDFGLIPPDERVRHDRHLASLTVNAPIATIELRCILPNGRTVLEEWTDHGIFDADGRLVEIQAVGRDVTEQRRVMSDLAESEGRYRAVVEAQTEFIVRMTPDGYLTFVNDAYCRYHGRSREELLSPLWCDLDVLSSEERARFAAHLDRLTPEEPVAAIELRHNQLANRPSPGWSAWTDRGIFDDDGRLVEVQSVGRDITDRVLAEHARQEAERLRMAALEAALDGFVSIDEHGVVIDFNPAAEAIFGHERSYAVGRPMADLIVPPDLRAAHEAGFARHLADGSSRILGRRIEVKALNAAGIVVPIELVIVRGASAGKPVFLAYLRDLSAQKRSAAELAAREAQFRTVAEGVPLSIIITTVADPEILFVNERAHQTLSIGVGDRGEAVLGLWTRKDARAAFEEALSRAGVVDAFEAEFNRPDGTTIHTLVSARPIVFQGRPAILSAITDITRQRAAEAELARQREALHQSEKLTALGSLLAGVAHELNNPLSVVVGYSAMLGELSRDPAVTSRAQKIHAAAERCGRIVRTFLAMARKRPPTRNRLDMNAMVTAALELTAYGLRSGGVEVRTDLAEDLPLIWGDEDQLHQVVVNLVINAQQALRLTESPRQLTVETRNVDGAIALSVADSGPGMTAAVAARIFEPYFTTKPDGVGTGIGLSVSHSIVTAHGGSIDVDSAPGRGSRFTVVLPIGNEWATADEPAPSSALADAVRGGASVLVVDDEPDIGAMVAELLHGEGHSVTVVTDASAALRILEAGDVDLVVSDLRMPGLDGPGLHRALKERRPDLLGSLLFVTGDTLAADVERFLRESGAAVIEKPIDPVSFRRIVGERLCLSPRTDA